MALLSFFQNQLIYFPSYLEKEKALTWAERLSFDPWHNGANKLIGWKRAEQAPFRMLIIHGNAGHALMRTHYAQAMNRGLDEPKWDVYLLEYPGYGARPGSPSEEAFYTAAREAIENLLAADERPLFVLGESIGSAVASKMASTYPQELAGLLLITPLTSLADVGSHHYPFLPVRFLLRESYNAKKTLQNYRGPVGFVVAGQDEIIPTEISDELFESYGGAKRQWVDDQAAHNTLSIFDDPDFWSQYENFISPHLDSPRTH